MKRLISILLVVAMMLASVLAMIPASAAEKGETPVSSYNINWKNLYENNLMAGQWWNELQTENFTNNFAVDATENSFNSTPKAATPNNGTNYSYYSTVMFDITADTYYEYTFEAKNNRAGGYAGVVFAYDTDLFPYFVYGEFDNDSDEPGKADFRYRKGHDSRSGGGHSSALSNDQHFVTLDLTADGYGQFKCVYNGLEFSFYALSEGEYKLQWTYVLPEGAKLTSGVYNRENSSTGGQRTVAIRNNVVSAYNDATAAIIAKADLNMDMTILAAKNLVSTEWSAESWAIYDAALKAAQAVYAKADATKADVEKADADLAAAFAALEAPSADKAALSAKITAAEATLDATKFEATAWETYQAALTAAKEVLATDGLDQATVDAALATFVDAIRTLVNANKTALVEKLAAVDALDFEKYTPVTWAPVAKAYAAAKELNDSDFALQADIDAAIAAIDAALPALKERPATKAYNYNVNWLKFFNANLLRSQWWNNAGEDQNKYLKCFDVTITENFLSSAAKDSDNLTYYTRRMYDITESTYYEYTFEAKNMRSGGYAGVMFAYDTNGTMPYFVYGEFDNKSDNAGTADFRWRRGHNSDDYIDRDGIGSHFMMKDGVDPRYYPVVAETEDGYGQFKFIYDGFNFSFHYLDANGDYVQVGDVITLPAGAKICPGVYSKATADNPESQSTMAIRNCVISAFNAADALSLAIADLGDIVSLSEAEVSTGKYTEGSAKALADAVAALKAELAKAEPDAATIVTLGEAVYAAKLNLIDNRALTALLDEIAAKELKQADWTTVTWTAFAAALEVAQNAKANATAQADVDAAVKALKAAYEALDSSAEGDKTALNAKIEEAEKAITADKFVGEEAEAAYKAYLEVLNAAKKVSADKSEFGNQTATDKALKDLIAAMRTVINADRTALKAAIDKAEELVEGKFETTGWAEFVAALAAAKTTYDSDSAYQADLDAALTALTNAQAVLVRKPLSKKAEYKVNWKYMYENALMHAQWRADTSATQDNFEDLFTVNATENQLNVVSKVVKDDAGKITETLAEPRAYYSTAMYKITATTAYEYTFQAKRDSELSTYAGVIFAYNKTSVEGQNLPYMLYGGLNNLSDYQLGEGENKVNCSYIKVHVGHQDDKVPGTGSVKAVVGVDADNFATYKVVYDGYFVEFYYLDADATTWVAMPDLRFKLPETAMVCFGTYTRDNRDNDNQRTVTQRNGVLVAMNDEAKGYMEVNKTALAAKIAEVEAMNMNEYTTATWDLVAAALDAAKKVNADANAFQPMVDDAIVALESAVAKLGKPGDSTALKAKIAEIEAFKAEDYKNDLSWKALQKTLTDAKAVAESRDSTQGDIDMALALLTEAATKITRLEKEPEETKAPETETKATETEAPEPVEEGCGGCGSSAAISAIAIVSIIGTAVALKKKED